MMPRPARLVAIARRDLSMELKGRRGWVLPIVMAGLLLPVSGAPPVHLPEPEGPPTQHVTGDVPQAVLDLPGVVRRKGQGTLIFEEGDPLRLSGVFPPESVREVLDAGDPGQVEIAWEQEPLPVPGRMLLFALISASTLTGAVSASIGGERTARTLVALLAAAVTRVEVILGKWLAWGGLGAFTAGGAALVAILLGRVEAGWWLLPMLTVPLCAVALSLWLVRRASDVIGGTTVTLRVVPAVVGTGGLVSWFLGLEDPLLGAAVPLGGALVAAGATWGGGALPALVASGSTLLATGWMLRATWSDLEETVGAPGPPSPRGLALRTAGLGIAVWWLPLLGPMLWGAAGNEALATSLPRAPGAIAGALGLAMILGVAAARETTPSPRTARPSPVLLGASVVAGLALALLHGAPLTPLPEALGDAQERLFQGLRPDTWLAGVAVALSMEGLFRGWLLDRAGRGWSLVAWWLVCCPLDPLGGLVAGVVLADLSERGGPWCAVVAHLCWLLPISLW